MVVNQSNMQGVVFLMLLVSFGLCSALVSRARNIRGRDLTMMARKPIMAGNWKMNTDLEVCFKVYRN